jgi:hypothetical protein
MSDKMGFRPVYRKVKSRLQFTLQSSQASDAYFFRCWRPLLKPEQVIAIMVMRDLAVDMERTAELGIAVEWDYTTNIVKNHLQVSRATWYRWLDDPLFTVFVHRSPDYERSTRRDGQGQLSSAPVLYDVEMETPLTPEHQRWFDARTDDELDQILHDPRLRTLSAMFAMFPMPDPEETFETHRDVALGPVSQGETSVMIGGETPVSQGETPASYPQPTHSLSTGYPPPMSQGATKSGTNETYSSVSGRDIEGEGVTEGEDHYDFLEVVTRKLNWLFDTRQIGAPDLRVLGVTSVRYACRMLAEAYVAYVTEHGIVNHNFKTPAEVAAYVARIAWRNAHDAQVAGTDIETPLAYIKWHFLDVLGKLAAGDEVQFERKFSATKKPTATPRGVSYSRGATRASRFEVAPPGDDEA